MRQIIDIITIKLKFVDENLNVLLSPSLTFLNNIIPKSKEKTLINISLKKLNNIFEKAKHEMSKYISKFWGLNEKFSKLQHYCGSSSPENIIPREFDSESIKIVNERAEEKKEYWRFVQHTFF